MTVPTFGSVATTTPVSPFSTLRVGLPWALTPYTGRVVTTRSPAYRSTGELPSR